MKVNFLKTAAMICLCVATVCSCVKDGKDGVDGKDGKDGIAGTNGKDGADGTNGTDGTDGTNGTNGTNGKDGADGPQGIPGNAGVMMYQWRNVTFTAGSWSYIPLLEGVEMNLSNSLVYFYYNDGYSDQALPHPFLGSYAATWFFDNTSFSTRINILLTTATGTSYTGSVTWDDLRMIVVPVPQGNIVQLSVENRSQVDWSNYSEVAKYFGLPE